MAGGTDLLKALGIGAGTLGGGAALHGAGLGSVLEPLDYPRQALYNLFASPYRALETGDASHLLGALPGLAGAGLGFAVGGPVGALAGSAFGGLLQGAGNATGREQFSAPSVSDLTGTDDFLTNTAVGMATDPLSYAGLGATWGAGAKAFKGMRAATPISELTARAAATEAAPVARAAESLAPVARAADPAIAATAAETRPIGGFRTANGSDYAFENGLTTRTRNANHPHGAGTDPQSIKTIFIDDAAANEMTRLRQEQGARRWVIDGDNVHVMTTKNEPLGTFKFMDQPQAGMAPVEFTVGRGDMYGGPHIGNPITELHPIPTAEIAPPNIPTAKPIAPMFYSRLEEGIQRLPETIKSESVINKLKKIGVTDEEISSTNFAKVLEGKKKVTRQELLDHFGHNKVQVGEVIKGDAEFIGNPASDFINPHVKFESRTTPGGENYKEMLLTLPPKKPTLPEGFSVKEGTNTYTGKPEFSVVDANGRGTLGDMQFSSADQALENFGIQADRSNNYVGSHWDEPNVVAHARFNDRVGPNGEKILHVEEIQSDWHQTGKKHGYAGGIPEGSTLERTVGAEHPDSWTLHHKDGSKEYLYGRTKEEAVREYASSNNLIPDAPFKENWHELTMKRLIRHAAENGYDAITLNTGEQAQKITGGAIAGQAKFYGTQLSAKELGEIALKEVRDVIGPLELTKRQADLRRGVITPEKYGELLKKEATVPDWMKKYAKQHGVEIEQSAIPSTASQPGQLTENEIVQGLAAQMTGGNVGLAMQRMVPVTRMPINASMREQVLTRGFPLMQYGAPIGGSALMAALMGQQQA